MKKLTALLLAVMMIVLLCACGAEHAVPIDPGASELYTHKEIAAAAKVVINHVEDWDDRTLLRIRYDEDCTLREIKYRKERYGEETVMVLLTDIRAELGALAVGPFYPGQTCTDYQFVLTRDARGRWNIQDSGYA